MELNKITLEAGECLFYKEFFIIRNEYAYVILRACHEFESLEDTLHIGDEFYRYYSVEDLSTYTAEDFR